MLWAIQHLQFRESPKAWRMLYYLSVSDLFRQSNFLHMLGCSFHGKVYFLKTDKILPVEIWQKTKCWLILVPRQSHSVVL